MADFGKASKRFLARTAIWLPVMLGTVLNAQTSALPDGGAPSPAILGVLVPTATALSHAPVTANPSTYGESVFFTVSVLPSNATGTITLKNTTGFPPQISTLATKTLAGGQAAFTVTTLPAGSNTLTATYSGDSNFAGGTSNPIPHIVYTADTTVTVAASPNPASANAPVTLTATVRPVPPGGGIPTGSVSISGALTGTVQLDASGKAVFNTTFAQQGIHVLGFAYNGDAANNYNIAASSLTLTVNAAVRLPATTTLAGPANPTVHGQPVTLTASVSPNSATGNMAFREGNASLGTAALSGGQATLANLSLSVGTHSITATYSGDSHYNGSTSAAYSLTVNKASTAGTLTASPNPAGAGTPVTFNFSVNAVSPGSGTPTGNATLAEGSLNLGTATTKFGGASFTVPSFLAGAHQITATYVGDANFAGTSKVLLLNVVPPVPTTTTASVSPANAAFGQSVTISAAVSPNTATGTVSIMEGATVHDTKTLSGGSVTFTSSLPYLAPGTHNLIAAYSGDSSHAAGTSPVFTLTVTPLTTTTTLTASPAAPAAGQSVTLTATVASPGLSLALAMGHGMGNGVVGFHVDGANQPLAPSLSAAGTASFTTSALTAGSHTLAARYAGSAGFSSSLSNTLNITVGPATKVAINVTLTSGTNPAQQGQAVQFSARVSGQSPGVPAPVGNRIDFLDGGTLLGPGVTDATGGASLTVSTLTPGTHNITASYAGNTLLAAGVSPVLVQTVQPAAKLPSNTLLAVSTAAPVAGQPVVFTATVTAAGQSASQPTGSVQLLHGANVVATAPLSGGLAHFNNVTFDAGSYSMAIAYLGDSTFNGSTSTATVINVSRAAGAVSLTSSANPSQAGQLVLFTARVTAQPPGAGNATGVVQFLDGGTQLGSAVLDSAGSATYSASGLTSGAHNITAAFSGDANLAPGTSAVLAQTVSAPGKGSTSTHLAASSASSVFGQAVTFTVTVDAAVSGAQPSGSVQLLDGGTVVGTAELSGASAQFSVSALAVGVHGLTAVYAGDSGYNGSASPGIGLNVTKAGAAFAIASSANPSIVGRMVTFTASVESLVPGQPPLGTVQFLEGGAALGTAVLSGGSASFPIASLALGAHQIQAAYSGDGNYSSGNSPSILQTVVTPAAGPGLPTITSVNTAGAGPDIAQNTWIEITGTNLTPADTAADGVIWSTAPEFASGRMPTQLGGVSVTVNGKPAYVYFFCSAATSPVCKSDQINVLTPLDSKLGSVEVKVTNGSNTSAPFNVNTRTGAPSLLLFGGNYVAATHADGRLLVGPADLYPGLSTPAKPNETIVLYSVGFGLPATPLVDGSSSQTGTLFTAPAITIGGIQAIVQFAGLISPGLYQFNVVVPGNAADGDNPIVATYAGLPTPAGDLITVHR